MSFLFLQACFYCRRACACAFVLLCAERNVPTCQRAKVGWGSFVCVFCYILCFCRRARFYWRRACAPPVYFSLWPRSNLRCRSTTFSRPNLSCRHSIVSRSNLRYRHAIVPVLICPADLSRFRVLIFALGTLRFCVLICPAGLLCFRVLIFSCRHATLSRSKFSCCYSRWPLTT